ncbi:integrase [Bradyrhizobium sp. LB8.2]|uniref:tyrosine-type recombinase/integrase n=1 Tax=unclassified Bradyrhizobium TaxID=2631580 RepID=UPI00339AC27A
MHKKEEKERGPIRDSGGVYHYRRRIPDDVRRVLRELDANSGGKGPKRDKREEKKRLGRNEAFAKAAWEKHHQAVEARWAELRSGRTTELTRIHIQALAGEIHRRWLKLYPPGDANTREGAGHTLRVMQEIDGEIEREFTSPGFDDDRLEFLHGDHVDAVLAARGLIVSFGVRWGLIEAAQDAAKHACRVAIRKAGGDLRADKDEDLYPDWPNAESTTLSGLCAAWTRRTPTVKPETHASFKACVDQFIAFAGHNEVSEVTVDQLRKWIEHLKIVRRLSDLRIKDGYFAAIKTIFNSARKQGLIRVNPCDAIVPDGEPLPRKREKDLRDGEVYAILKASLKSHADVSEDVANTRRWVPWLLAYTGARVAEMTRLESRNIVFEAGAWAIDIEESKNGRPRIVPIHRHLVEQGFLDFVRRREGMPLFFGVEKLKDERLIVHKTRAEGLAEWARKVAEIEKGTVAPNHGWRHRFRTECRRISMDREVRLYIQGHAFKMEGEKYGFFPVDVTSAWMDLFPTYDVHGSALRVERVVGNDVFERALAFLHNDRRSRTSDKAA